MSPVDSVVWQTTQSTLRSLAICHTLVRLEFSSAKAINYAYMIIGILIIHIIVIDSTGLLSPLMLCYASYLWLKLANVSYLLAALASWTVIVTVLIIGKRSRCHVNPLVN